MKSNRGISLMELIVYASLALLAGLLLYGLQKVVWNSQVSTTASYLVSGQTETAIEWLRRELGETALASISAFPSMEEPEEAPGVSFVSNRAYEPELKSQLLVNSWGAPLWDKHVLYTLDSEPGERTGNLVRWERTIAQRNYLPVLCDVLPSEGPQTKSRVLLRSLLLPEQTVEGVGPDGSITTDAFGGFRVQFLRRLGGSGGAEELTTVYPWRGNPRDNTRLLEVELKILQQEHRTPNYYSIRFRAAARH